MELFESRQLFALPRLTHGDWDLKMYAVVYGTDAFRRSQFDTAVPTVLAALPQPARTPGRLGVGFLLLHQGRTMDYMVLAWWDRENELPIRIWVNERGADGWREARGQESVCVWDLEVIWAEREAYVSTILASHDPATRASYLSALAPGAI